MTHSHIPVPSEIFPVAGEVSDDEAVNARQVGDHELGNPELPIADYREQIVNAVDAAQATVITAKTGAGKSTQVPQFLAEAGYEVIVTQPRIVAARTLSERVRSEIVDKCGKSYADFVGYRTARERDDEHDPQILYVTDGLQQIRELSGAGVGRKQVLVLDEVHEWNENMEVLVAWSKRRMREDPNFKVVTMSATLDAEPLARYFGEATDTQTPVIEVPGHTFEVKKDEGGDVVEHTIHFAKDGKNTLVFVPGKAEIERACNAVEQAKIPGVTVLPLHGQLDGGEQKKVFEHYDGAKVIVATNVAQTSITIDDIDAVVDSGLARRNEVKNGVEGLYLRPISRADCLQRAGRAGRTKAGEYVLAQLDSNPFVGLEDREPYGTPEILRTRLDGLVLRLAKNGFDADEFDFFHSKDREGRDIKPEITAAKQRLTKLGAFDGDGKITKIGRQMERMPVESHYARMMIEARQYGPEVQTQLAAMLATEEAGGITFNGRDSLKRWAELVSAPGLSDMLVQLQVYIGAQKMSDKQKKDHDISIKNYRRANETYRQLRHSENLKDVDLTRPDTEQRQQLVRCIVAGMVDNVYTRAYGRGYEAANGENRELGNRSTISGSKLIVGKPFDLSITTRRGPMTLHLIESATEVPSLDVLREVAPQLFIEQSKGYGVNITGRVVEKWSTMFEGRELGVEERETEPSSERTEFLIRETARRAIDGVYGSLRRELGIFAAKLGETIKRPEEDDVVAALARVAMLEVDTIKDMEALLPHYRLEDYVTPEQQARVYANYPANYFGIDIVYDMSYTGKLVAFVRDFNGVSYDELPEEALVLPSGMDIYSNHLGDTLKGRRESIERQRLADEHKRAQQAEAERIENERIALANAREIARDSARNSANTVRGQVNDINPDDLPAELADQYYDLYDACDDLYNLRACDWGEIPEYIDRLFSQRDALLEDVKEYEDSMKQQAVSDEALAALQARYSNH